tara:strand:+ start:174 stop:407 length:234 start_codon:yes stop_codon:yes gene_type:complete
MSANLNRQARADYREISGKAVASAMLVQDVSALQSSGWIAPVPGGVGPVTVAVFMQNTVVAACRLQESYSAQFSNNQ